jgi:hypothetical protein
VIVHLTERLSPLLTVIPWFVFNNCLVNISVDPSFPYVSALKQTLSRLAET